MLTMVVSGRRHGCAEVAKLVLRARRDSTPRVRELHTTVGHTQCELVEADLAEGP